jgi:hypothetical protein
MGNKTVFSGRLEFISLADIFQILGGNGSSGTLRMTSKHSPGPGVIHFSNGNPVNAVTGSLKGLKAVYALFGWVEGNFEFQEEDPKVGKSIKESRMQIVLDALRMLDDGAIEKLGPPSLDVSVEEDKGEGKRTAVQIIKGPLPDYSYIIEEEEFRDGERIVKQGGHGKWLWVIFEGEVDVYREIPDGELTIARLGEGCFIGTFAALLFREYARTASVKAVGDVRLGLIDTEQLSTVFNSLTPGFRKILLSLDDRLKNITQTAVDAYTKSDSLKKPTGDHKVIIKKGSDKEELFTLKEGDVQIVTSTKKGPLTLCSIGKDTVFGYIPFLDMGHELDHASVAAVPELKADKLDIANIQEEYDSLPGTFQNLIYVLGTLIFATTRMICRWYEEE